VCAYTQTLEMGEWDIKSFSDLTLLYYCKRHRSYIYRITIVRGHDYNTSSRLRTHTHTHTHNAICGTCNNIIRTHTYTDMIKQWISTYVYIFFFVFVVPPSFVLPHINRVRPVTFNSIIVNH